MPSAKRRVYVLHRDDPQGSPCPSQYPDCVNSGLVDQRGGCSDQRQFADFRALQDWARQNNEELVQARNVQEAITLCETPTANDLGQEATGGVRVYVLHSDDPQGSPCPPGLPNCVNSGLILESQGMCGDQRQFATLSALYSYAESKGEKVRRARNLAEAIELCSPTGPAAPIPQGGTGADLGPGGTQTTNFGPGGEFAPQPDATGGDINVTVDTGDATGGGGGGPALPDMLPMPMPNYPGTMGPSTGNGGGMTNTGSGDGRPVYRFILELTNETGTVYGTGASYPACSRSNPDGCEPIEFTSLQAAIDYAESQGEIPVMVDSEETAWRIIEGAQPITEDMLLTGGFSLAGMGGGGMLLLFGIGAAFLLKGRKR